MDYQTIQATARTTTGKSFAREMRRAGLIPAVAYGGGEAAQPLAVNPAALIALKKSPTGWNTPFHLVIEGGDDLGLAMLREVQKHPIKGNLLHADFLCVKPDQTVQVEVPLVLSGKAKGIELGGRLQQTLRAVTIRCLPGDIPPAVDQDVTDMDVGEKLMLSGLAAPANTTLVFRHDASAVQIARGRGAATEAVAGEAGEEVEEVEAE